MAEGIKKISENVIINKRALIVTDPSVTDNEAISIGALWTDPILKGLKIKTANNSLSLLDASQSFLDSSITSNLLADKCIIESKIADNAITNRTILDNTINGTKILNNAITENKLANNSVISSKIKDKNILTNHIADGAITSIKLANNSVTTDKINNMAITKDKLANNSVTEDILASRTIDTRHFKDRCITNQVLALNSVDSNIITNKGIASKNIGDKQIVTRTIANGAIVKDHIVSNSIATEHIINKSVTNDKLADDSVSTNNIIDKSITTNKIVDRSITKDKLATDVINIIGDPVLYEADDNVILRKGLTVNENINVTGDITANRVYNAVFMDIAEAYIPNEDEVFIPGDIVQVNDEGLLIRAINSSSFPIVGVVSDEYATCYGATDKELEDRDKIAVGMIGKVHVNVIGPVNVGDYIALAKDGMGASYKDNNLLKEHIIGKALETNTNNDLKKVLCLIYPN